MTKILVVEDESSVRENILDLLTAQGFEAVGAENGHVGITWAWDYKPDLIICDVMMPELDGYEMLRLLRREPATALMPFIFLSANADKADIREGMALGADDYLTKPFTHNELLNAIATRLKKQAAITQQSEQLLAELRTSINDQAKYNTNSIFANDLAALKRTQFSGKLSVKSAWEQEWTLYFYLGRILYATGGIHPLRRWQRIVTTYCPQIKANNLNLFTQLSGVAWEYQLLASWLRQEQISREQVGQIIREIVVEVLFDILQAGQVKYQSHWENSLPFQLLLIDVEQALTTAQKQLLSWHVNFKDLSPNKAPAIARKDLLQQQISTSTYQQMSALLGGQSTLRELAVHMKRHVVEVASALLPYLQTGVVQLVELPDLSVANNSSPQPTSPSQATTSKPVIACIDDSPLICEILEKIVVEANCECVKILDPLRAIATLLQHQPDLIFLDLVMPNLNGYEICTRLRKISALRNTPIVLLSGNLIDRMRAKVVGASECLDKPVNPETVLKLIDKYLSPTNVGARSEG